MQDPTREEIIASIAEWHDIDEIDPLDIEESIYWFAANNHAGQASNLYTLLSESGFQPGATSNGPPPDSMSDWLLGYLETSFA